MQSNIDPAFIAAIGAGGAVLGATVGAGAKGVADYFLEKKSREHHHRIAARLIQTELVLAQSALSMFAEQHPPPLHLPEWAHRHAEWDTHAPALAEGPYEAWRKTSYAYALMAGLAIPATDKKQPSEDMAQQIRDLYRMAADACTLAIATLESSVGGA